jgi:hypothetical protein
VVRPDLTPDWAHFAPEPEEPPSRLVRTVGRLRLGHEWTIAVVGSLLLAALLNWQALLDPTRLPRGSTVPALAAYLVARAGHTLTDAPTQMWQLNAFFPTADAVALGEPLLGWAPAAMFGSGVGAAVLRYHVLTAVALALALFGAYALARQLGGGRFGALVAGLAFAVAPWRLGDAGRLLILATAGMALALAMLARGHDVRWRRRARRAAGGDRTTNNRTTSNRPTSTPTTTARPWARAGWILAGWLVLAWQLTTGFALGLVVGYLSVAAVVLGGVWFALRRRRLPPWPLLVADGLGVAAAGAVAVLMAGPYLAWARLHPDAAGSASAPTPRGLLTAPAESLLWGSVHAGSRVRLPVPGDMALLPGYALGALAVAGLLISVWRVRVRIGLLLGLLATFAVALGPRGPVDGAAYRWVTDTVPGLTALRQPGHLVVIATLLLGLLAAGGMAGLAQRAYAAARRWGVLRPAPFARAALLLPALFVLLEGLGNTPHAPVPAPPAALSAAPAPYLILPTTPELDRLVMLWSVDGFVPVVNGDGPQARAQLALARDAVRGFPDPGTVQRLRDAGVRTVVVLTDRAAGTEWADAATRPFETTGVVGVTRETLPEATVFHLD